MATELNNLDLEAQSAGRGIAGYDLMGKLMGEYPETAIFRSFCSFSAENLLYLQAELVALENELRDAQREDQTSTHIERRRYAVNWARLSGSLDAEASHQDDGTQWAIVLEMRSKMREYREFLRQRELEGEAEFFHVD